MKAIAHTIKAIIFDMDGTIIKTEELWKNAKIDALISLGVTPFTEKHHTFLNTLSGLSLKDHGATIKAVFKLSHPAKEISKRITDAANRRFKQKIDFVDGFEHFHQKLQTANIPSAIATNTNIANLVTLVSTMQLDRFFGSHIYSQEHAGFKPKPDPAVFLHAAQQLGAAPEHCIVFEDSMFGFQAAKAAGMRCIAIKHDGNHKVLEHANTAIATYHDAEKALRLL